MLGVTAAVVASRSGEAVLPTVQTHFDIIDPPGVSSRFAGPRPMALSPDGARIAFIGVVNGVRHVFVRSVESPDPQQIPGTSGTNSVTFSPDGTALAVITGGGVVGIFSFGDASLRTLPVGGDVNGAIAWGSRGIVMQQRGELWFFDPAVGVPRQLTTLDESRKEVLHANAAWLDDRVLVFTTLVDDAGFGQVEAVTLDAAPRRTIIMERSGRAMWSPTSHLVFERDSALLAVPFDLDTLKPTGPTTVVLPAGIASNNGSGSLTADISRDGTLAYGLRAYGNSQIVLVNRDGSSRPLDVPASRFTNPRVSPDGRRLAVDDNMLTIALVDLARGTKVTPNSPAPGSGFAMWNSDGTRLAFRRNGRPHSNSADGKQDLAPLKYSTSSDYPTGAGPAPDDMLAVRTTTDLSAEVYLFSLSGAYPPKVVVSGRGYQGGAQLSPDGRWLVYQSDETGQPEIYVRAYPALDRTWQVSVGGGVQARWGPGGREVFYRTGNPMVGVTFDGRGAVPILGKPQVLFDQSFEYGQGISVPNYDVLPDGRFVMLRAESGGASFRVIRHWADGLKGK
ncbi:MAG: Serine/threonine-protein kinase PknA [Acidobacteriota bacterium]